MAQIFNLEFGANGGKFSKDYLVIFFFKKKIVRYGLKLSISSFKTEIQLLYSREYEIWHFILDMNAE